MQKKTLPKPKSEIIRPEISRFPELTLRRRIFRSLLKWLAQCLVWLCLKVQIKGQENFPLSGASLVAANHLGDADVILGIALSPRPLEFLMKAEIFDFPILGWIFNQYGVIWIHRGQPDRRALRAALQTLEHNRMVCIAPEGRESLSGSLEEGTRGAAFLALKSQAPILPITYTQTENWRILENLKHFKKTEITITIGKTFALEIDPSQKDKLDAGTREIMQRLASQLPEHYRGAYQNIEDSKNDGQWSG